MIAVFPKILDNIDIVESLAQVYSDDFWTPMNGKEAKTCDI